MSNKYIDSFALIQALKDTGKKKSEGSRWLIKTMNMLNKKSTTPNDLHRHHSRYSIASSLYESDKKGLRSFLMASVLMKGAKKANRLKDSF